MGYNTSSNPKFLASIGLWIEVWIFIKCAIYQGYHLMDLFIYYFCIISYPTPLSSPMADSTIRLDWN